MRDDEVEAEIQERLESGCNVWVVGDVHGYFDTFHTLVQNLKLEGGDCIVSLGDLIDRGPTSAHAVKYVRTEPNIYCVRGNHEQMMIEGFDDALFFRERDRISQIWYHNGGVNTEWSYLQLYESDDEACDAASSDVEWMSGLPTEIVLDDWRLVHAGYDSNQDPEDQSEVMHMYVRKQFFDSKKAIDPDRTILFGHSPTFRHLHKDDSKAGQVWFSDILLEDGRPMAIGLDTCLYHNLELPKVLAAFNLQTSEIFQQVRIED